MKTFKTLLFAALATIGFSFAAQAVDEPLGTQTPREGGWWRMVKTDTGTDLVLCYTDTATAGFTWTVPDNVTSIDYLVVGGGGSGGSQTRGGGGGAGGLVTNTLEGVSAGNVFSIYVGAGGPIQTSTKAGNNGSDSTLACDVLDFEMKGLGGGGGGYNSGTADGNYAKAGGSGGGAAGQSKAAASGGAALQPESVYGGLGYPGGTKTYADAQYKGGSGGGGAGGAGTGLTTSSTTGRAGGPGVVSSITGEKKAYAGGGGGGGEGGGGAGGAAGGITVGGAGGKNAAGKPGVDGTGSGGGGAGNTSTSYVGGKGGDGAVILRFTMPAGDFVTVNVAEDHSATYEMSVLGEPVANGGLAYKELPVKVVATPEVGYEYVELPDGWSRGDTERSITREFTAGDGSFEISIPAALATSYEFALTQSDRGSAEATLADGTYGSGQLITLTAEAKEGYFFAGWLVNGEKAGWLQSEFTIMMNKDKIVEPVFYRIDPTFGYDYAVEGGDEVVMCTNVTKSGAFTIPDGVTKLEYLVVGGGGAGGTYGRCGGGGAGGLVTNSIEVTAGGVFSITVGAGAAGRKDAGSATRVSADGKDSVLACADLGIEIKGLGGGGGGTPYSTQRPGRRGGSGGGVAGKDTDKGTYGGGASTQLELGYGLGNPGGNKDTTSTNSGGAGGGGAGHAGYDATGTGGANGGEGVMSTITGSEKWYAGGGGGGGSSAGKGGSGVGGNGSTGTLGGSAVNGTGSGGGGTGNTGTTTGGSGGDGVVILRYTPAFPVTFSDPENATVSAKVDGFTIASGDLVLNGEDVVVEVTPDEFYEYAEAPEGWEKVEDSTAITRTFKVDYKDLEIEAPAPTEKPTFTVTTLACENGSIEGAGTYHRDEVVTLTAIPADGYAFKAWTGAAEGQEGAVIQLTVTANVEVGATFEKMAADKRLVYYTGGENTSYTVKSGDEDVPSGSPVDVGAMVVVVVTPNEHYAFTEPIPEGWEAGEEPGSLTKSFKADEDVTFEIPSAELITFVLEVTQPEHGLIRGAESGILTEGDLVELSVEFDGEVYQFLNWTTNGAPAGTEITLSFTMQDNMSVAAVIEKIPPVELKINNDATRQSYVATTNGVEVPAGSMLDWNATVTIVATSQFGYKYLSIPEGWSAGKEPRSITRDFTANTYPLEVTIPDAEEVAVYSLSITEPVNGEISGAEPGSYETGDQVSLIASPSVGYRLAGWTVNGEDAGSNNPLALTLEADTTVAAVFAAVKIPRPYVRVEYISTTSTGKQYVDTGIGMQNKLRVEFDFKWNAVSKTNGEYLMGGNYDNKMQYVLNLSNKNVWRGGVDDNRLHEYTTLPKAVQDKRYTVESLFDNTVHTLTIDGLSESFTGTTKTSQPSGHLFLFNYTKDSGYPGDATLYSCRMFTGASSTNQGTLVREFLPVYDRETEKYGLYDTVNGKFYPSASGDFIGAKVQVPGLAIMLY